MERTYWSKQTVAEPLFPDLQWSRPETKSKAGKLLIIGGNAHGFAAPATAYQVSSKTGAGRVRIILPEHVRKLLPPPIAKLMEFAPSNPSGSFARPSLAELLDSAAWADGVLLAGDLGRNSETAIVLESFVQKYQGPLVITQDAADYFIKAPREILMRPQTTMVISFAQLQKLATSASFTKAFTFEMDFLKLIEALHEFTEKFPLSVITKHHETLFVGAGGQVSTTKLDKDKEIWRVETAASAAVWQLQNPTKLFEALTTSLLEEQKLKS